MASFALLKIDRMMTFYTFKNRLLASCFYYVSERHKFEKMPLPLIATAALTANDAQERLYKHTAS